MVEGEDRNIVSAAAQIEIPGPAEAVVGHTWSLEEVFREHHTMVFRSAYRITGNAADAEDVLQTVFMRLSRNRPADVASIASYLYRAAVNCALDMMRSRQTAGALSLEEVAGDLAVDPGLSPEIARHSSELREWLRRTVARLSPRAAEMFALRFFEGKDNAEIAELMDSTEGTVAVTLHRARMRLLREFQLFAGGKSQ
jgi:RNA polymerase sigma-70 factor (ECF subfamily)